ncbi:hypothetical protein HanIR_Chr12g0579851 [Helianthus annuus]|nr:hypothetical protein HanIR_Chr12g0579851 [Helianthus annuus]
MDNFRASGFGCGENQLFDCSSGRTGWCFFVGYAELLDIDGSECWPCKSGRIPKTLRFDPLTSRTSGLFVAKFTKHPERQPSFQSLNGARSEVPNVCAVNYCTMNPIY